MNDIFIPPKPPIDNDGYRLAFSLFAVEVEGGNPARHIAYMGKKYVLHGTNSELCEAYYVPETREQK